MRLNALSRLRAIRCRTLTLRPQTRLGLIIRLALLALLIYLLSTLLPHLGRIDLSRDLSWFDLGWYGFMPLRTYRSTSLTSPDVEFLARDARCCQDFYVFAPRGPAVRDPGGIILDNMGELVWRQEGFDGDTQDLRVQEYKGEKYLTFWVGAERDSQKKGVWYMMDETYTVRHQIYCTGSECDMHEFQITESGTALLAVYEEAHADLSSIGGSSSGWILDCRFQEVDIETGHLLFEWTVSEHVPVEDTYNTLEHCTNDPFQVYNGCGNFASSAFDFYHINSLQKDDAGNYLVSGRNTHDLMYIDGSSGEVLWHLGGKRNDFEDLSAGAATNFSWQHYARWTDGGISLFDNAYNSWHSPQEPQSRAMILDLDTTARTVALRKEFTHPDHMRSQSQGNAQILPSGNMFVGWGRCAAFSEFAADGTLLCDAHFGASAWYSFGPVSSYRVFREKWTGRPTQPPDVIIEDGVLYVSWNGATEVRQWLVEGRTGEQWKGLARVVKTGFETSVRVPRIDGFKEIRVSGLGEGGEVLGQSEPLGWPGGRSFLGSPLGALTVRLLFAVVGCLVAMFVLGLLWQAYRHLFPMRGLRWRRRGEGAYQLVGSEESLVEDRG